MCIRDRYIPIDELIVGNGIKTLEKIINTEFYTPNNKQNEIINKSVVKETLKNILTFLDANKAVSYTHLHSFQAFYIQKHLLTSYFPFDNTMQNGTNNSLKSVCSTDRKHCS